MTSLSVLIATRNEEQNIAACLSSVKEIADEILVADAQSTDRTVEIARSFEAIILPMTHKKMFHENKEAARHKAKGKWILFLDADEIVTKELAAEIRAVANDSHPSQTQNEDLSWVDVRTRKLFAAHAHNIAARDGVVFHSQQPIAGYFIARKNFFLGKYLMHSGVYPDGVIRLVRNGKAYWPCKDVHETMIVDGGVSWLGESMIHMADPTFSRYLDRANRYTSLTAAQLQKDNVPVSVWSTINYLVIQPLHIFFRLFVRHKGFLDGWSGFVWSLMSGLHQPIAYLKHISMKLSSAYIK